MTQREGMVYAVIAIAIMYWLAYLWLDCASSSPPAPSVEDYSRWLEGIDHALRANEELREDERAAEPRPPAEPAEPAGPAGLWCGLTAWKSEGGAGYSLTCTPIPDPTPEGAPPRRVPSPKGPINQPPPLYAHISAGMLPCA